MHPITITGKLFCVYNTILKSWVKVIFFKIFLNLIIISTRNDYLLRNNAETLKVTLNNRYIDVA